MNEGDYILDNARKRYLASEFRDSLADSLKKQDYKLAKMCAESLYETLFYLREDGEYDEREKTIRELEELSRLIDSLNEGLILGGQAQ